MLIYNGSGEHIPGIPARDLSDADIARIALERGIASTQVVDELTARGLYSEPSALQLEPETDEE